VPLKQARMLPHPTCLPSVPPEKWLIKSVPSRRRYETVKVTAFDKSSPSSAASLRSTTSVATANDKLVSASFNVKVKFRPQAFSSSPILSRKNHSRFSNQLHHLMAAPPLSFPSFLVRDFTVPTALPISSVLSLKPYPSPQSPCTCTLNHILLQSSF
jgi:hypothetical protein